MLQTGPQGFSYQPKGIKEITLPSSIGAYQQ